VATVWRVAKSLDVLLRQLNTLFPDRNKESDGSIGDAEHASRASDHNPWYGPGIVTARDYTHDPAGGLDCNWLSGQLVPNGDRRIKYVIWDRRIWQGSWQPYSGADDHNHHLHLSVVASPLCDDTSPWNLGASLSGGFLMALTDAEQRNLYNRVFGMTDPQRFYATDKNGKVVEVAGSAPGAKPARVLDSLDGNYLVGRLAELEAKVSAPAPAEVDYDRLAGLVVERLGALRFDAEPEGK
jgi:hypothetical protein